jgi:hypothetical protein
MIVAAVYNVAGWRATVMNDRIGAVSHNGKQILVVDLSNCSTTEVEKTVRAVPEVVTARALNSVLMLVDFTEAAFDLEVLRAMKEAAVFNKPYIKRTAWVGAQTFPDVFRENLQSFSGRHFPTFKSRLEALEWLTAD